MNQCSCEILFHVYHLQLLDNQFVFTSFHCVLSLLSSLHLNTCLHAPVPFCLCEFIVFFLPLPFVYVCTAVQERLLYIIVMDITSYKLAANLTDTGDSDAVDVIWGRSLTGININFPSRRELAGFLRYLRATHWKIKCI